MDPKETVEKTAENEVLQVVPDKPDVPVDQVPVVTTNKKSNRKLVAVIVSVLLILVVAGASAFLFLGRNNNTDTDNSSGDDDSNQGNTQKEVCNYNDVDYKVGENYKNEDKCENCTCGADGEFSCVTDTACQSAKDNEEFFKTKIFYVNSRGYRENDDPNLSAAKYEVYMYDIGTKQKKQLTYTNKDKTLSNKYQYDIRGVDDYKNIYVQKTTNSGTSETNSILIKLNLDTLKWEELPGFDNTIYDSSLLFFLKDTSFSYLKLQTLAGEKALMNVENYQNGVSKTVVKKNGLQIWGRGGSLEDVSLLKYTKDNNLFFVKQTTAVPENSNYGGSIGFATPIWVYNSTGVETANVEGTYPSWLDDGSFVYLNQLGDNFDNYKYTLNKYSVTDKTKSTLTNLDSYVYRIEAYKQKALFWDYKYVTTGKDESETFIYDLETKKLKSLAKDFNESKWLNDKIVLLRQSKDCTEAYKDETYQSFTPECPPMHDASTLIELDTIWSYDLTTDKTTEYKLTDDGDAVYDYFTLLSFK